MKRILLSIVMIFFWISIYPESARNITWEPVPGAWGYALEIKNSVGNIVVNTEIKNSSYSVSQLEAGEYFFRIATLNMLKQKGVSTDWIKFTIERIYFPKLISISKKQIVSSKKNKDIVVKGRNFRKESLFYLRGNGKEIKLDDVNFISENEVIISCNPSSDSQGLYDLVILNRGDAEAVLKNAVQIVAPGMFKSSVIIGAGYMMGMPLMEWEDYIAPSFTGGKIYVQFPFENIFLEMGADAIIYKNASPANKSSLLNASFGLGAGYSIPFASGIFEIFIKFNGGPVYTILTLDENYADKQTASIDLFASAGCGVRFNITESFFVEPALNWKTIFYKDLFLHSGGASLSAGVRF